jgi:hypothetical protein
VGLSIFPGEDFRHCEESMTAIARTALLVGLLGLATLLAGCPGMPGAPGGEQKVPAGMLPPPGLDSGGARTLMGATIVPPDNAYLLVRYTCAVGETSTVVEWHTCRRVIPLESCLLVEGINYDGRAEGVEKDVNRVLPFEGLVSFEWKYEERPAPPAVEAQGAKEE